MSEIFGFFCRLVWNLRFFYRLTVLVWNHGICLKAGGSSLISVIGRNRFTCLSFCLRSYFFAGLRFWSQIWGFSALFLEHNPYKKNQVTISYSNNFSIYYWFLFSHIYLLYLLFISRCHVASRSWMALDTDMPCTLAEKYVTFYTYFIYIFNPWNCFEFIELR